MTADVMIREVLVAALEAAFPGSGMRVSASPDPVATSPAACADVGDVKIYDDGDEATVVIENVTHHPSNPYDSKMSPRERAAGVTQEVVEFLRALFDDRVFLWARQQGKGGGLWKEPFDGIIPEKRSPGRRHVCVVKANWKNRPTAACSGRRCAPPLMLSVSCLGAQ
ncbi:MAG: hypothetical protein GC161_11675 [Planctomycetaceae bacterium]|nr:hypothetical protein [Planctomycetaceae bacterium]